MFQFHTGKPPAHQDKEDKVLSSLWLCVGWEDYIFSLLCGSKGYSESLTCCFSDFKAKTNEQTSHVQGNLEIWQVECTSKFS